LLGQSRKAGVVVVEAKLGADGGAEELKKISGVRDVMTEVDGDWKKFSLRVEFGVDVREEIFRLATARHWTVRELSRRRATLEDVFVEITHPDQV
jgi:ABC-2 type transport system ATP-binding protein